MALSSTLYRFKIRLSDIDRGIYETVQLRIAKHPSEAPAYLLTRVIAYALNSQDGLAMTEGVAAVDEPALWVKDPTGLILCWIEIGNPSPRRLHKASKAAKSVRVYTYRDPAILLQELAGQEVHRLSEIEVFSLPPKFLEKLAATLDRDNAWELLYDEGELSITVGSASLQGEMRQHQLG